MADNIFTPVNNNTVMRGTLQSVRNRIQNFIRNTELPLEQILDAAERARRNNLPGEEILAKARRADGNNLPAEKTMAAARQGRRDNLPAEKIAAVTRKGMEVEFTEELQCRRSDGCVVLLELAGRRPDEAESKLIELASTLHPTIETWLDRQIPD